LGIAGEVNDTIGTVLPDVSFDSFPLAAGIDHYGRTMFNQLQLPELTKELEQMLENSPTSLSATLNGIIELCREGAEISDAELWVLGD
jgi:hypothetical protein